MLNIVLIGQSLFKKNSNFQKILFLYKLILQLILNNWKKIHVA